MIVKQFCLVLVPLRLIDMASGTCTVEECSPHHPMVEGLRPATTTGTRREKMAVNIGIAYAAVVA